MKLIYISMFLFAFLPSNQCVPGLRDWLSSWRACRSDCPVYLEYVCGFDPQLGYMLADNTCLLVRHNLCHRTNYEVTHDPICEHFLNMTQHFLPPLIIVSNELSYK